MGHDLICNDLICILRLFLISVRMGAIIAMNERVGKNRSGREGQPLAASWPQSDFAEVHSGAARVTGSPCRDRPLYLNERRDSFRKLGGTAMIRPMF